MEKHDSSYRQFFSSPRMVRDFWAVLIEPVPKSLQRHQPQFEYFLLDNG